MSHHIIDPSSISSDNLPVDPSPTDNLGGALAASMPGVARRGQGSDAQEEPPAGNTGALIHSTSSIDWLDFTIPTLSKVDRDYYFRRWSKFLHGAADIERNMHGYDRVFTLLAGKGFMMWNRERLDMGLHITLSAQALALWCAMGPSDRSIYELLIEVRNCKGKFTRIDVAFDTPDVHIDQVREAIEVGELVTKARDVALYQKLRGSPGTSIYIGSKSSDRLVRIYDKASERGVPGVWTRFETQYRKKYADKVVDYILLSDVSMESLVVSSFDFREVGNVRTNTRSRSGWWSAILGEFEKVEFTIKRVIQTVQQRADWVRSQVSRTLATCFLTLGKEWLDDVLDFGVVRMTAVDRQQVFSGA